MEKDEGGTEGKGREGEGGVGEGTILMSIHAVYTYSVLDNAVALILFCSLVQFCLVSSSAQC